MLMRGGDDTAQRIAVQIPVAAISILAKGIGVENLPIRDSGFGRRPGFSFRFFPTLRTGILQMRPQAVHT
jgi:hypothetical protein